MNVSSWFSRKFVHSSSLRLLLLSAFSSCRASMNFCLRRPSSALNLPVFFFCCWNRRRSWSSDEALLTRKGSSVDTGVWPSDFTSRGPSLMIWNGLPVALRLVRLSESHHSVVPSPSPDLGWQLNDPRLSDTARPVRCNSATPLPVIPAVTLEAVVDVVSLLPVWAQAAELCQYSTTARSLRSSMTPLSLVAVANAAVFDVVSTPVCCSLGFRGDLMMMCWKRTVGKLIFSFASSSFLFSSTICEESWYSGESRRNCHSNQSTTEYSCLEQATLIVDKKTFLRFVLCNYLFCWRFFKFTIYIL